PVGCLPVDVTSGPDLAASSWPVSTPKLNPVLATGNTFGVSRGCPKRPHSRAHEATGFGDACSVQGSPIAPIFRVAIRAGRRRSGDNRLPHLGEAATSSGTSSGRRRG